jgi:hypothetical protein
MTRISPRTDADESRIEIKLLIRVDLRSEIRVIRVP